MLVLEQRMDTGIHWISRARRKWWLAVLLMQNPSLRCALRPPSSLIPESVVKLSKKNFFLKKNFLLSFKLSKKIFFYSVSGVSTQLRN